MDSIYIIIVTYNATRWLEKCLESVALQIPLSQVIIVDNSSTDDTLVLAERYSELTVLPQNENLGFGMANNLGVQFAIQRGAQYVFLLNQDTRVKPQCIVKLLEVFKQDDTIAIASPFHLNTLGDGLDSKFESYITSRSCPGYIADVTLGNVKQFYPIMFVNAAAWMLKTNVVKRVGLFSKEFFHYGEDSNFLQRLRYFKYTVVLVPGAYVHHDRDERRGEMTETGRKREVEINRLNLLLNINESLGAAYVRIIRYAGLLVLQGRYVRAFYLLFKSSINYFKIVKLRKSFMNINQ